MTLFLHCGVGQEGPRCRPRAPALAGQSALSTNFPNSSTSCQPPSPPPPASPARPGSGAQGEARAGSPAVSCRSRVKPAAASECTEPEESPRPVDAPAGPRLACWAPPGWGVAEAWASRGPASACSWLCCSFCSGLRPVSRKRGDRHRIRSAGSSEVPQNGVESGMGGVRGGRECCAWLGCCVLARIRLWAICGCDSWGEGGNM